MVGLPGHKAAVGDLVFVMNQGLFFKEDVRDRKVVVRNGDGRFRWQIIYDWRYRYHRAIRRLRRESV